MPTAESPSSQSKTKRNQLYSSHDLEKEVHTSISQRKQNFSKHWIPGEFLALQRKQVDLHGAGLGRCQWGEPLKDSFQSQAPAANPGGRAPLCSSPAPDNEGLMSSTCPASSLVWRHSHRCASAS